MDNLHFGVIALIKSALTGEKVEVSADYDWDKAIKFAVDHKVAVMLYYGIYNSNIKIPEKIYTDLSNYAYRMALIEAQQEYEKSVVFSAFDKNNIEYLPLKGAILKGLYQKPEMRYMGDIDVLIKIDAYDKIRQVMTDLDFKFIVESNHEYIWHGKMLRVELHKHLIPSYNKDYFAYYGDGWLHAKPVTNTQYVFSDEDFLIYIFTHLAKHYRDSGIGIKHFVDIWVYLNSKPELNKKYIETELKKLQLFDFYENCLKLLSVWFENAEGDDVTALMSQWIFSSGVFGTKEQSELSTALKKTGGGNKKNRQKMLYVKTVFPSFKLMKKRYPVLKKLPFLLPIFWVVRLFSTLLFNRKNIEVQNSKLNKISDVDLTNFEESLKFVGLEFNFKE